jgi:hypothetical protein
VILSGFYAVSEFESNFCKDTYVTLSSLPFSLLFVMSLCAVSNDADTDVIRSNYFWDSAKT